MTKCGTIIPDLGDTAAATTDSQNLLDTEYRHTKEKLEKVAQDGTDVTSHSGNKTIASLHDIDSSRSQVAQFRPIASGQHGKQNQ